MQSAFPGFTRESIEVADVRKIGDVAHCSCEGCTATTVLFHSGNELLPFAMIAKIMSNRGWRPDKRGKHLCPLHHEGFRSAARRPGLQPVATTFAPGDGPPVVKRKKFPGARWVPKPKLTPTNPTPIKEIAMGKDNVLPPDVPTSTEVARLINPAALGAPRTATPKDNFRIVAELMESYDTRDSRYCAGFTDEVVARKLAVPRAWVADVRNANFGPEGENEDMINLRRALDEHAAKVDKLQTEMLKRCDELDRERKVLQTKFDALTKSFGPALSS